MIDVYHKKTSEIPGPWLGGCEEESWDFFEEPSTEGVIDNHYNGHKKPLN